MKVRAHQNQSKQHWIRAAISSLVRPALYTVVPAPVSSPASSALQGLLWPGQHSGCHVLEDAPLVTQGKAMRSHACSPQTLIHVPKSCVYTHRCASRQEWVGTHASSNTSLLFIKQLCKKTYWSVFLYNYTLSSSCQTKYVRGQCT